MSFGNARIISHILRTDKLDEVFFFSWAAEKEKKLVLRKSPTASNSGYLLLYLTKAISIYAPLAVN